MKRFNAIYLLLFILLVMGAFASMAQNRYGLKIMGGVAFIFGLFFIIQLILVLQRKDKKDMYQLVELACLFILSFIFGLRVFYIHFTYIEFLFGAAGVLLLFIYLRKMILRFHYLQPKNSFLAILILVFYLSIVFYFISIVMIPFVPKMAEITGVGAFLLLLVFIIVGLFKKNMMVDGQKISSFSMIRHFKDHSIIIASLFFLLSFYLGMNRIGLLPDIYSDEFPRAYYELVDRAVLKKEKPVNGRYRHEDFKEKHDQFIRRVKSKDN